MSKVLLVDGSNQAFRAFHAISGLTRKDGFPTNALYGFLTMLLKMLRDEQPDALALVFDPSGPTFRHKMFPEYKGHRPDMPEDLRKQWPVFRDMAEALGMTYLVEDGWEADDLIGTLAQRFAGEGHEVVVVSGDKDLLQLVGPRVRVLDARKGTLFGPEEVKARFGVLPDALIDVLALWGDASDNVPGVKGIGEKRARGLIESYGNLDGVYQHIEELKGKLRENLEAEREQAYLSRELVTIRCDVPMAVELSELLMSFPPPEPERAGAFLETYELHSLAPQLNPPPDVLAGGSYIAVTDEETFSALLSAMKDTPLISIDTETTDLRPNYAELVGISLCFEAARAWYIPLAHEGSGLSWDRVRQDLAPILEDAEVPKIGQHIKYDQVVLARAGLALKGVRDDTMLLDMMVRPSRRGHGLNALAQDWLGHSMIPFDRVVKDKGRKRFDEVPIAEATDYAAEDAHAVFALFPKLRVALDAEGDPRSKALYRDMELPLSDVLARMELHGVLIDTEVLSTLSGDLAEGLAESEAAIYEMASHSFNINSPKQVAEVLFQELELPVLRKTKTGPSTDARVLKELAAQHPLPDLILRYREYAKLKNTYVDVLPKLVHPETGRVHTSFSQTAAATGRLSSSEPNLQNIPIRTPEGRRIRQAFVAAPGHVLVSADYSQIELRVLAHLCGGVGGMAEAFLGDADVHTRTAAQIFDVMEGLVTEEMRRTAKAINFGLIYGQGDFGLAQVLGISRAKARRFIETYFQRYPEVQTFMERTLHDAAERGYTETLLGRRRPFALEGGRSRARTHAERAAINAPVQGSAAEIIKQAMLDVDAMLGRRFPETRMLLQVHDELVFEVEAAQAKDLAEAVVECMEQAVPMLVPLRVSAAMGSNWGEAH